MTRNQLLYQQNVETKRSNQARETETNRSNLANETENKRWHQATEAETERSNKAREAETQRSNLAKELETNRANVARETETTRSNLASELLKSQELRETTRTHKANEAIGMYNANTSRQSLGETERSNLAKELETARHNQAVEAETGRSNLAQEDIQKINAAETQRANQARELENTLSRLSNEDKWQQQIRSNEKLAALDRELKVELVKLNDLARRGQIAEKGVIDALLILERSMLKVNQESRADDDMINTMRDALDALQKEGL